MKELGYTWEWLEEDKLKATSPALPAVQTAPVRRKQELDGCAGNVPQLASCASSRARLNLTPPSPPPPPQIFARGPPRGSFSTRLSLKLPTPWNLADPSKSFTSMYTFFVSSVALLGHTPLWLELAPQLTAPPPALGVSDSYAMAMGAQSRTISSSLRGSAAMTRRWRLSGSTRTWPSWTTTWSCTPVGSLMESAACWPRLPSRARLCEF